MDENALTARIRMLTEMEKLHEGYSKAVKLVMGEVQRGTLHHIHGPVAGLLHVPDQYTVAIETALGAQCRTWWWTGRRTERPSSSI